MREVDTDRSGAIDREDFKTLMLDRLGTDRARLELAFSVFDQDGSGVVGEEEFRGVMGQVGVSNEDLRQLLATVDGDGDGRIDFEEFCRLVDGQPRSTTNTLTQTLIVRQSQPHQDQDTDGPTVQPESGTTDWSVPIDSGGCLSLL